MEEVCRERRAMREYSDPVGEKVQPTNEMRVSVGLLNFKVYPQFVLF